MGVDEVCRTTIRQLAQVDIFQEIEVCRSLLLLLRTHDKLSWSPDGAFIAASNAMNGPVFVAAVIEREGWRDVISFVGHENTIQVAVSQLPNIRFSQLTSAQAFNPRLFFLDGDKPGRATASTMVALGADDFSISIWRNTIHQPLVVLKDIFAMALMDLCW